MLTATHETIRAYLTATAPCEHPTAARCMDVALAERRARIDASFAAAGQTPITDAEFECEVSMFGVFGPVSK